MPLIEKTDLDIIRDKISQSGLLCQLAEEAAELAQAALKLKRAMEGTTPVTEGEARYALLTEIADVLNCINVVGIQPQENLMVRQEQARKLRRWVRRLGGTK